MTDHYDDLKPLYTEAKGDDVITSYPELSGVIGFTRIAQQLDQTADYEEALAFAVEGLTAGQNFDQFLDTAESTFFDPEHGGHGYTTPIFMVVNGNARMMHFNRDIGRFLQANSNAQATAHANQVATDVPLWWMTDSGMTWGENAYASPEISWSNFMLNAYVVGTPVEELKLYLDAPNRHGDLFYIQKLVATLEQGSGAVDPVPTQTPGITDLSVYLPLIQNDNNGRRSK